MKYNDLMLKFSSTISSQVVLQDKLMTFQANNENCIEMISNIKGKFCTDIEHDDKMNEFKGDIIKLEACIKNTAVNEENSVETFCTGKESLSESIVREHQEKYTTNQIALNDELENVNKMLSAKEHLAKQLLINTCNIVDFNAYTENENKIKQLEEEKENLLTQLKSSKNVDASKKLSESRKKQIQELEVKITELRKKVSNNN